MIADVNNCKLGNTQVKKIYNDDQLIFAEVYEQPQYKIVVHSDAMETLVLDSLLNKLSVYPESIRKIVDTPYDFFFCTLSNKKTYYIGHIDKNNEIIIDTTNSITSLAIFFDDVDTDCFWTTEDANTFYKYRLNEDRTTELITTITPNAETITGFAPNDIDDKHNFCCYGNYIYYVNGSDGYKYPVRFNKDGTNVIHDTNQLVFNNTRSIYVNDNGVYVTSYDGIIKFDHDLNLISYYTDRGEDAYELAFTNNGDIINNDYILDKDLNIIRYVASRCIIRSNYFGIYSLSSARGESGSNKLALNDTYDIVKQVEYSEFNWIRTTVITQ